MPIATLLGIMAMSAALAGLVRWYLASNGTVFLIGSLAELVPPEKHVAFLADLWAHNASDLVAIVGGTVLAIYIWRPRKTPGPPEHTPVAVDSLIS